MQASYADMRAWGKTLASIEMLLESKSFDAAAVAAACGLSGEIRGLTLRRVVVGISTREPDMANAINNQYKDEQGRWYSPSIVHGAFRAQKMD